MPYPWSLAAFALLAAPLALAGCRGSMSIWGVNVPLPGDADDDDSSAPVLDFSAYDGSEAINIDWSQELEEQGRNDCMEWFDVFGTNSTVEDQALCPDCDEVWTVTLVAQEPTMPCLNTGTGLQVEQTYIRKVGIGFIDDVDFRYYRTRGDDPALAQVGIGAMLGVEYTWSGLDGFIVENPEVGFSRYFSGEGTF